MVVDIVAQNMPSENDVHIARNYLMKILRSSMRYSTDLITASLLFLPAVWIPSTICQAYSKPSQKPSSQPFLALHCVVLVSSLVLP